MALLCQASGVERSMVCLLLNLLKVFTASRPLSDLAPPEATRRMFEFREMPGRPQRQDLTDPVWDMTVRCWEHEPDHRPKTMEVVATLREWQVFSSLAHGQRD